MRQSYKLAVSHAYLEGRLKTGANEAGPAPRVPDGYAADARSIVERRMALAGFRLADQLISLYGM